MTSTQIDVKDYSYLDQLSQRAAPIPFLNGEDPR
jgi:hypothetical protein